MGVVLIAVTVIIIVATKGSGGGDDDPDVPPVPPPVDPPINYNPYKISSIDNDGKQIKGYLSLANTHVPWTQEERKAYTESIKSGNNVGLLNPKII